MYLHQEELTGLWGEVRPTVGTPNVVEEVVMDSISGAAMSAFIERGPEGGFLKNYSVSIAHELGHAVNIMHHGDETWEADRNYEIAIGVKMSFFYARLGATLNFKNLRRNFEFFLHLTWKN